MEINKATHESYKVELVMPLMKNHKGKYLGILSDDSVDRDNESISASCIRKLGRDDGYLVALCNHYNDVFMIVAEWTNRGAKKIDGHTALVAEAKFYNSNPKAMILKGMLDEGAIIGVSISAIVKDYDEDKDTGQRTYTDLELLEASFVAIPANKHGRAMLVAKSYKKKEMSSMNEITQKDVDAALDTQETELTEKFTKQLETKESVISELKKGFEDLEKKSEADVKETKDKLDETNKKLEASEKKVTDTETEIEKVKKDALEKQKYANQGGDLGKDQLSEEEVDKAFAKGELPVIVR